MADVPKTTPSICPSGQDDVSHTPSHTSNPFGPDILASDHLRSCRGREYRCCCGYDAAKDAEIERLRAALIPFARIWAVGKPLTPPTSASIRGWVAGTWPTMADAKAAYDLVWRYRKDGE